MTDERIQELKETTLKALDELPDQMSRWELMRFFMGVLHMYDITGEDAALLFFKAATEVEQVNAKACTQVAIYKAQQESTDQ